jgi:hypothetical protein
MTPTKGHSASISLPVLSGSSSLRITPTDVSQFVNLEQCERYLRLRLTERAGHPFLEPYDVAAQRIAPLMTVSGRHFEDSIETTLRQSFQTVNFARDAGLAHDRPHNNPEVLRIVRSLDCGESILLLQTRLAVERNGWLLRGDVDLIKLSRTEHGQLRILIADVKSTAQVKVEHRLQIAFYRLMLTAILEAEAIPIDEIQTGILFRPPVDPTPEEAADAAPFQTAAEREFTLDDQLLEIVADPDVYEQSAHDLVLGRDSTARRVAGAEWEQLPYNLSFKCDGCVYTEFCMKWSAETEDLSLLPYMTGTEKEALRRNGIDTIQSLATLKEFPPGGGSDLIASVGREEEIKRLSATWPIGPRLDELIHRAKSFRRSVRNDGTDTLLNIPDKGNSSLPVSRPDLNPNLVWIYIDAQHDHREGRLYLLGAWIVACRNGVPSARRAVVHLTDGPPDTSARERDLFVGWTRETLAALVELTRDGNAPDTPVRTPIHVVFFDRHDQRRLLEGLARNYPSILERTPPFYDFLTQLAAFDSPIASFLDEEVRTFKNFPMTCQNLQSLAAFLRFDWNTPQPFRDIFHERVFDYLGKLDIDGQTEWYTRRARFGSSIPLEYAYSAWGRLPVPDEGQYDEFAPFRRATPDLLVAFQTRRLESLEHVARSITGNPNTQKTPFALPDIARYEDKARTLADALDEFIRIERFVTLGDWKASRHAQPEQRVLMGEALLVRYHEEDQDPGVAETNRDNERRRLDQEKFKAEFRSANPDKPVRLPKDQSEACRWSPEGLELKLRIETTGVDCDLNEVLLLSTLREGSQLVLFPRWTVDERLPAERRIAFTPTPKQMLYGQRAELVGISPTRMDPRTGRVTAAIARIVLRTSRGSETTTPFVFGAFNRPLIDGGLYTLDPCPNEWYAYWCSQVVKGLRAGESNALYDRLVAPTGPVDSQGTAGQTAFLDGMDAFHALDPNLIPDFEPGKREYIGAHARTPILLVQGPPGTGKSFSTAYAVFARIQGAMRENRDCRVFQSCKTHAATDVLLRNMLDVRTTLHQLRATHRKLFDKHFDRRLLEVPLYRVAPKDEQPEGVIALKKDAEQDKSASSNVDTIREHRWAIVAVTPGGTYSMLKTKWKQAIFGREICDLLVLDEASQMNIPESLMAALPLKADAPIVVVGDHRQMPPIVKHDWDAEARRTFREFAAFESLFDTLRARSLPMIRFEESFRLHKVMAEFLREEVYRHDGIRFHSKRVGLLRSHPETDPFVAAALDPDYPLVVVVHEEGGSQVRNRFERELIVPILGALTDPGRHGLDPTDGFGVVVPHRAQRAELQESLNELQRSRSKEMPESRMAVDTVERFQGGERDVIVVSATESDRGYLLASAGFLLDPRRLTVAVSRAKAKMILVASRNVFSLFSPDEESFRNSLLWKNLLARTCRERLWSGVKNGIGVQVWGGR